MDTIDTPLAGTEMVGIHPNTFLESRVQRILETWRF